ncbi:MAG: hypothetical protein Q7K03_12345 [Dehalococcoidia bacterium]|nr:hypothetical protein [Dehalococcoidia bacterium]
MANPLLDGVYIRIGWTSEHIRTLKNMQRSIEKIDPDTVAIKGESEVNINAEGNTEIITPWFDFGEPISDPAWSRELGYTVYNLRASLDYLVYALAFLDSGSEKKGTQFPICSNPSQFKKSVKRGLLRGVNPTHKAAIEALQPYNGGNWLKELAGLSNPDKHMHLSTVASQNLMRTLRVSTAFDAETQTRTMNMELDATRFIAFPDSTPVIPLLNTLETQITDTVNQFAPDF